MSKWSYISDLWSEDNPAVVRLRNALQGPQDAPERPFPIDVAPVPIPEVPVRLSEEQKRERLERIAALVARLEAESGDAVAADQLRRLLDQR